MAALAKGHASEGRDCRLVRNPLSPEIEFTRINIAESPAAAFVLVHRKNKRSGARKIPPPVEVIPDRKPIPAPTGRATTSGAGLSAD